MHHVSTARNRRHAGHHSKRLKPGFEALECRSLLAATPIGNELLVNSDFTQLTQETLAESSAVAARNNGGFAVVYSGKGMADANGVFMRQIDSMGNAAGESRLINQTTSGNQSGASITSLGSGAIVVWSGKGSGDSSGVFMRRLDAAGTPIGPEIRVNQTTIGTQQTPAVTATSAGGFVVAWSGKGPGDSQGIFTRSFASDGTPTSNELLVNSTVLQSQKNPTLAATVDGGFAVAWDGRGANDSAGVFWRRFDASGMPRTPETRVNTTTLRTQGRPAIAVDAQGQTIIAWEGAGAGDLSGIFAQRFDANARPIGTERILNTHIYSEQKYAHFDMALDGRYVVTWSSNRQDGDNWGVYAREFDANDAPRGSEFLVNTTTRLKQQYSSLVLTDHGDYTIVWSGAGSGDSQGVFARLYVEPNRSPQIEPILDRSLAEGETLTFTAVATDADDDVGSLRFSLEPGAPTGASVNAVTGVFNWVPSESQGPGNFTLGVRVTDPAGGFATTSFRVAVSEVNSSPTIESIAHQTVEQSKELVLLVVANDLDLPSNILQYSLEPGAPTGVTIHATQGVLRWKPTLANTPGDYTITIRVADNGSPGLFTTQSFTVTLLPEGDNDPPVVSAGLEHDTGAENGNTDTITYDATIAGTVTDESPIVSFRAWLDGAPASGFVELMSEIQPSGAFVLSRERMNTIAGGVLLDGPHVLHLLAIDQRGNTSPVLHVPFVLDTVVPNITITSPVNNGSVSDGAWLTGAVTDETSGVFDAIYQLGTTPTIPILFATFGVVDQQLNLDRVPDGNTLLRVSARDVAGNEGRLERNIDVTRTFRVLRQTPLDGAIDVGSTYRPQVFFSQPVDPSSLTAETFFATFAGEKIPANIVPANDGSFAWLYFTEPLPSSARISVTLTADVRAESGDLLDGDQDGIVGGDFTFDFKTVSLVGMVGTTLSGRLVDPGPDLIPHTADDSLPGADGQFRTGDDQFLLPIAGVKVFLLGREDQFVFTDSLGHFQLDDVPVGNVKVDTDGRTAPNQPLGYYFPDMVMDANMRLGEDNFVMPGMEVMYLPRLRSSILQNVNATTGAQITVNADGSPDLLPEQRQYLSIDVPPNSLIGADGLPLTNAQIGISTVPPELVRDMLPPGVLQHTFDITVQAMGVATFSQPAPMRFPNVFNAAPGTKLNFLSFDHTTGRLVIEGTVTVSADGLFVSTDPNTGITHPGWHGMTPPGSDYGGPTLLPSPSGPGSCNPQSPQEAIPIVEIEGFKDYLFHNDDGEIKLRISNLSPKDFQSSRCRPPDNPAVLKVRFKFDSKSIASEFLDNLPQAAFSIGPGEEKTVEMHLKKLLDQVKTIERDRLYGVQLKIEFETGKGKSLGSSDLYIYRFLDVADDKHDDGIIEFADTIKDGFGNIDRKRNLEMRVGPNSEPILEVDDRNNFAVTGFPQKVLVFDPVGDPDTFDRDVQTTLSVRTPDDELVDTLLTKGDASPKFKINVNKSELQSVLAQIASGGDGNVNYILVTANERALFDTAAEQQAIADAVEVGLRDRFSQLSQGIEIVDGVGPDNAITVGWKTRGRTQMPTGQVFDSGLFGASGEFTLAGIPVPGAPHVQGGNGVDNADEVNTVIKESGNYNSAERNFRMSNALNQVPQTNLDVFVDNHLEYQLQNIPFQLSTGQLVNALVQTVAHEGSHTLGAPHPTSNINNIIDAVEQQLVTLSGDLANGAFQLRFLNDVTLPIPGSSPASVVQAALQFLPSLLDNVTVSGPIGGPFVVQFTNHLVGVDLPQIVASSASLGASVSTTINGASHEVPDLDLVGGRTDIMFDGHVDWQGELRFRSGVTLEVNKMGLKIDWTETDAERVYNLFSILRGRSGNASSTYNEILGIPSFVGPVLFGFESEQNPFFGQEFSFGTASVDGPQGGLISRTITLVNVGTDDVILDSVTTESESGAFTATIVTPGTVIPAGEEFELELTFDPQIGGDHVGLLHINSNAASFPDSISLIGTGVEPTADGRFTILNNNLGGMTIDGSVVVGTDIAVITNIGSQPLVISQIDVEDPIDQFTVAGLPSGFGPTQPLTLLPGESFSFDLIFNAKLPGLQRAVIVASSNDPDAPILRRTVVGTGMPAGEGSPAHYGRDYLAVETPFVDGSPVLRQITDDNGNWRVFLPADTALHVVQFDPVSGLVAHDYDVTAGSGGEKLVTEPFFFPSEMPDSDGDGLPDDIEFSIGTAIADTDTDNDGMDDFLELELGGDPLGGQGLVNGVVASAAIPGIAAEVVAEVSPIDGQTPLAYIASAAGNGSAGGLYIADIRVPTQPVIIGAVTLGGPSSDVVVDTSRNTAIVTAGNVGLHLVDISNPQRPSLRTTLQLATAVGRVESYQGRAYVTSGTSVVSIDLLTGATLQTLNLGGSNLTDITRDGETLFTIDASNTVRAIDLSSDVMTTRGTLTIPSVSLGGRLFAGDNVLYATASSLAGAPGFATVNYDDLDNLTLISGADNQASSFAASDLAVNGSGLLVSVGSQVGQLPSFDILNVSDPLVTDNFITRFRTPAFANGVAIGNGLGLVAGGGEGLQIVNFRQFDSFGISPAITIQSRAVDSDPNRLGTQIDGGQEFSLLANLLEDVQTRDAELVVNGQLVARDLSYPFDFQFLTPNVTGPTELRLQVRATDTSGNTGLSNVLLFEVIPTNPRIISTVPAPVSNTTGVVDEVVITFDRAIDASTLITSDFTLRADGPDNLFGTADDSLISFDLLSLDPNGTTLSLKRNLPLASESYRITIPANKVHDLSGNLLDGEFMGTFPTGNGLSGGDTVFEFTVTVPSIGISHDAFPLSRHRMVQLAANEKLDDRFTTIEGLALDRRGNSNVVVTDLNGDGRPDLVRASFGTIFQLTPAGTTQSRTFNAVSVRLQRPDGSYDDPINHAVGAHPRSTLVGDVNGDNKLDLVTVNVADSANGTLSQLPFDLSVLLGDGTGGFAPETRITTGRTVSASLFELPQVVLGRFTNDSHVDLALLMTNSTTIASPFFNVQTEVLVMAGNGDGSFQTPVTSSSQTGSAYSQRRELFSGDINGDTFVDLITPEHVLLNNGNGIFAPSLVPGATGSRVITVSDLTGDGAVDLLTEFGSNNTVTLSVLRNNGVGTFTSIPSAASQGHRASGNGFAADINGDSRPDWIVPNPSLALSVHLANPDFTFQRFVSLPMSAVSGTSRQFINVSAVDIDGNGTRDIISTRQGDEGVFVVAGRGNGTFTVPLDTLPRISGPGSFPNLATSRRLVDMTGDGLLDLVGNGRTSTISSVESFLVFPGNGDGTFDPAIVTSPARVFFAIGRVDAGAVQDVVSTDAFGNIVLLRGTGTGGFNAPESIGTLGFDGFTNFARAIQLADATGDGKFDVAVLHRRGITILPGNGDGTFMSPVQTLTATTIERNFFSTADLNGDSRFDFVVPRADGLRLLLSNTDGTVTDGGTLGTPAIGPDHRVAYGDFDENGTTDIALITNANQVGFVGQLLVYLGNGDGTFASAARVAVDDYTDVRTADVDGDGNVDVVTGGLHELAIHSGLGDGTFLDAVRFDLSGPQTSFPSDIQIGDVTGDGHGDVLGYAFLLPQTAVPSPAVSTSTNSRPTPLAGAFRHSIRFVDEVYHESRHTEEFVASRDANLLRISHLMLRRINAQERQAIRVQATDAVFAENG